MRYNKSLAIEYVLRKLIGHTLTLRGSDDTILIHELFGEDVGLFFFLLENQRTKKFFTMEADKVLMVVPVEIKKDGVDTEE